jgi:hypothetical protein
MLSTVALHRAGGVRARELFEDARFVQLDQLKAEKAIVNPSRTFMAASWRTISSGREQALARDEQS